jgi:hypothetical protein
MPAKATAGLVGHSGVNMDVGDWIAAVAAVIAAGSMCVALFQASEARKARQAAQVQAAAAKDAAEIAEAGVLQARRSAEAAEESAGEARKANELMRQKDERELSEREAVAVAEASKIRVDWSGGAVLWVAITNHGDQPIFDLVLEDVVVLDDPTWQWKFSPRVAGSPEVIAVVTFGKKKRWPIVFTSNSREEMGAVGERYSVTFSFTDSNKQRWCRRNDNEPEKITSSRIDDEPQSIAAKSDRVLHLEILTLIGDRETRNDPINVFDLPDELISEDAVIQSCLRSLLEGGLIEALTGDDRVLSVHGLTPAGWREVEELRP